MSYLHWTGERLETFINNENTLEHLHRYAIAFEFTKDKQVLDIACGEGYGSNLLAENARRIIGVDISKETIEAAKEKYKKSNIEFKVGSADAIPVDNNSIDIVVSFETLEHHDQHDEMMLEIKRVLKKDGLLIMSTPDKAVYADKTDYKNPFHVKELYTDEFKKLINSNFSNTSFLFQKNMFGSIIFPEKGSNGIEEFQGTFSKISMNTSWEPTYVIGFASDSRISITKGSIFCDSKLMKNMMDEAQQNVKNSYSFRLGNFILSPIRIIKKIING